MINLMLHMSGLCHQVCLSHSSSQVFYASAHRLLLLRHARAVPDRDGDRQQVSCCLKGLSMKYYTVQDACTNAMYQVPK